MTTFARSKTTAPVSNAVTMLLSLCLLSSSISCSYKIDILNNNDLTERYPNGVDNVQLVQGNTNDVKDKTFEILGFDVGKVNACDKIALGEEFRNG